MRRLAILLGCVWWAITHAADAEAIHHGMQRAENNFDAPVAPVSLATKKVSNGSTPKATADNVSLLERAGVMKVDLNGGTFNNRAEQFASFQTDAPSCDNCGAITVRNGNCYLCHNCGNSMGCS